MTKTLYLLCRRRAGPVGPVVFAFLLCLPATPLEAQEAADTATRTHAGRGLAWGAAGGALLGGLGLGTLVSGLCDTGDCDDAFESGFLVGALAGGAVGGLTGMVVGSAFPADGAARGGWSWGVRGGALVASERGWGPGPTVSFRGVRAVTRETWVGVEVEYLGVLEDRRTFTVGTRDGGQEERTSVREWRTAALRMVAVRAFGAGPASGGHLLAGAGVYPTRERSMSRVDQPAGQVGDFQDGQWVPAPGVGLGLGWAWPLGDGWGVELAARGDVVAGVGRDDLVGFLQLSLGLHRGP